MTNDTEGLPKVVGEFSPITWDATLVTDENAENAAIMLALGNGNEEMLVHFTLSDFLRFAQEIADCADNAIKFRHAGLKDADVILLGPYEVGR